MPSAIDAVFFDFGGVISSSPFEAFSRYEAEHGLPDGLIRRLNATNPDDNAWARLERGTVDAAGFADLFTAEAAAVGHDVDGAAVLELLGGELRPEMLRAIDHLQGTVVLALLTNNFTPLADIAHDTTTPVLDRFDVIVESSVVGVRKPDRRFYEIAVERTGIAPDRTAFLDDLGINLKPARAMGMHTIKVVEPWAALSELGALVGVDLVADH